MGGYLRVEHRSMDFVSGSLGIEPDAIYLAAELNDEKFTIVHFNLADGKAHRVLGGRPRLRALNWVLTVPGAPVGREVLQQFNLAP